MKIQKVTELPTELCCTVYCLPLHMVTLLAAVACSSLELFTANDNTGHPTINK